MMFNPLKKKVRTFMSKRSISNEECYRLRGVCDIKFIELKNELTTIKIALIGEDMRGGLVTQLNDLANKVSDIADATDAAVAANKKVNDKRDVDQSTRENQRFDAKVKYTLAIISLLSAFGGTVLGRLLELI